MKTEKGIKKGQVETQLIKIIERQGVLIERQEVLIEERRKQLFVLYLTFFTRNGCGDGSKMRYGLLNLIMISVAWMIAASSILEVNKIAGWIFFAISFPLMFVLAILFSKADSKDRWNDYNTLKGGMKQNDKTNV